MSSMSSSLVDIEAEEAKVVFDCFVDALTVCYCSIHKDSGGFSRVAYPEVYGA